jgi:hypothetical protein
MTAKISLEGFPIKSKSHPHNEKPGESASVAEYDKDRGRWKGSLRKGENQRLFTSPQRKQGIPLLALRAGKLTVALRARFG